MICSDPPGLDAPSRPKRSACGTGVRVGLRRPGLGRGPSAKAVPNAVFVRGERSYQNKARNRLPGASICNSVPTQRSAAQPRNPALFSGGAKCIKTDTKSARARWGEKRALRGCHTPCPRLCLATSGFGEGKHEASPRRLRNIVTTALYGAAIAPYAAGRADWRRKIITAHSHPHITSNTATNLMRDRVWDKVAVLRNVVERQESNP